MHRPPVNPRTLHRYHRTIMLRQPVPKTHQIIRECAEYLDIILLLPLVVGKNNAGRNAFLMNIQSATNGVHDPDNSAIFSSSHGLPPDKVFWEIPYQWITLTHPLIATTPFSSFVVPAPG